jgi:aconitate hydratase
MTVPDPTGQPDVERPIDLTDTPHRDDRGRAPTPEHHPDDRGLPGDDVGTPAPGRHAGGLISMGRYGDEVAALATAAAAALTGEITDPRRLDAADPALTLPASSAVNRAMLEPPPEAVEAAGTELEKAPSIGELPDLDPMPVDLEVTVAIAVGDDVSTDEILQAGAEALPYRSNIAKLAEFTFRRVDEKYLDRVRGDDGAHAVVAGRNYGQGSSREHAVLAPRSLGLRVVLARSYARIHWQNLVNFGVLPLEYDDVPGEVGDRLVLRDLPARLRAGTEFTVVNTSRDTTVPVRHRLSPRQIDIVLAGGRIPGFHG